MSRYRWGVSILLLYHLAAVGVGLLPAPADLPSLQLSAHRNIVDRAALALVAIEPTLFAWTAPARALTYPYREAGLRQKWDMFAAPKTADQYVRLDHLVIDDRARRTVVREIVLPAQRDDRLRLRHDFRDKAIINALDAFLLRVGRAGVAASDPEAARNDLGPVVRYFSNRLRDRSRAGRQTVERTELWYGTAAMPPPGESLPAGARAARDLALNSYDTSRVDSDAAAFDRFALGDRQREADIIWTLEYIAWP